MLGVSQVGVGSWASSSHPAVGVSAPFVGEGHWGCQFGRTRGSVLQCLEPPALEATQGLAGERGEMEVELFDP